MSARSRIAMRAMACPPSKAFIRRMLASTCGVIEPHEQIGRTRFALHTPHKTPSVDWSRSGFPALATVGKLTTLALCFRHKIPPEGETKMAYSLYDAAVTPCAQQLGALAGIIDKAAAHCASNKIEESALLQDRLYPDMFCLARQIRQAADFAMNTGGRLAGVAPPALTAVDDTSFAAAKNRVETALGFVKSLTREQVDGAENKVIAWKGGGNDRKMKGTDYLQQFALPNFFFFVTTAYDILRHRGVPLGKRDFLGPVNWLWGSRPRHIDPITVPARCVPAGPET